jgi:hypothetical protein
MICSEMFDPTPSQTDDWARPLFERQIAVLGRLAEAGLEIALAIERQAKADDAATAEPSRAYVAYARVARAVRLTLMLQSKLIKQLQAIDRQTALAPINAAAHEAFEREDLTEQRKARLERIIERIAKRQSDDTADIERLVDEASERLDHDDLYGDVLARPVSELVAMICRDLGLEGDWTTLAQEAWAIEEINSGKPFPPQAEAAQWAPARGSMGEGRPNGEMKGRRRPKYSPSS